MSAHWADALILAALLIAIWRGVAIGIALALAGLAGIALHAPGWRPALAVLGAEAAGVLAREPMWLAAFFLLMATALGRSGLAGAVFARLAAARSGRLRILPAVTVLFAALLGTLSGSVLASAGALRQMALEPLIAAGESPPRAAAVIAAGASLSTLIPPSLVLVFYAAFADLPVLHVFAAALLPGLVGAGLTAAAALIGRPGRRAAPTVAGAPRCEPSPPTASPRKVAIFAGLFLAIFVLLYGGWMTPLEVAALGAVVTGGFRFAAMPRRLCVWLGEARAAAEEIAAIVIVLLGAFVFSVYLALSGVPEQVIAGLAAHDWPPRLVLLALLAGYLLLGMVLEPIALVVASLPLSLPLVEALGYSPLWWAAALASVAATGLLTPPMGLAVFTATAGRTPTAQVFRELGVFLAADMVRLVLLVAWPALATALPDHLAAPG